MDVKVEKLNISREEKPVFEDFSITFPENKISSILAPSGWGKTTLLDHIAETNKNVSYAFQDLRLLPHLTVFQNITLSVENKIEKHGLLIEQIFNELKLVDLMNKKVKNLSGGEKQRVCLARALLFPSEILLLDEPFQNLDEELKLQIMNFIKELQTSSPRTVIFVTHDKKEADYLSNHIFNFS